MVTTVVHGPPTVAAFEGAMFSPQQVDPDMGPGAGGQQNLDAINSVCELARAAGGGVVVLPPGRLTIISTAELLVPSRVVLDGLDGAVLVQANPDRTDNGAVIRMRHRSVSASVTSGSKVLTVSDPTDWWPGAAVMVTGAGPLNDNEGSGRVPLYTRVRSVSGAAVTLDDAAQATVTNVTAICGAYRAGVRNLGIDGMRLPVSNAGTATAGLVDMRAAADCLFENIEAYGAPRSVMTLDLGSTGNLVRKLDARDYGWVDSGHSIGFGVMIFRGSRANEVASSRFAGDSVCGVAMDDRTTTVSAYDSPSDDNLVDACRFALDQNGGNNNGGVVISGSNRNLVRGSTFKATKRPLRIVPDQGTTPRPCRGNIGTQNRMIDCPEFAVIADLSSTSAFYNRIADNVSMGTTPSVVADMTGNGTNVITPNLRVS